MACEALVTEEVFRSIKEGLAVDSTELAAAIDGATLALERLAVGRAIRRCSRDLFPYALDGCVYTGDTRWSASSYTAVDERIPMPFRVNQVHEVRVSDAVFSDWDTIVDGGVLRLRRTDSSKWPTSGNTGDANDLRVTVITGTAVDIVTRNACIELAEDFVRKGVPARCGFDAHVISAYAQGVQVQYNPDEPRFESVQQFQTMHGKPVADMYVGGAGGWSFGEADSAFSDFASL